MRVVKSMEETFSDGAVNDLIRIPPGMRIDSINELVDAVFSNLSDLYTNRANLAPRVPNKSIR